MAAKTAERPKKSKPEAAPEATAPTEQAPEFAPEKQEARALKKDDDAPIYVRATRVGHYGLSRHYPIGHEHPRAGQVFKLEARDGLRKIGPREEPCHLTAEQQFSERWMERVNDEEGRDAISSQSRRPTSKAVIRKTAAERNVI